MSARPTTPSDPTAATPRPRRSRRRVVIAVVAVGLVVAGFAWGLPQWRAWGHWRAARIAAADRDFAAARDHLARCREVWPDDPATEFQIARVLRRGNQADATAALDRAEQLGHPRAEIELERALARTQSGNVRAVEAAPAAALGPGDDRLVREALVAGLLQGHFLDRAFRVTSKWVGDHPDEWQGRLWHARVLEHGLQYDAAADAYAEALRLRPGHPEAEKGRGEALAKNGRYPEAVPHLEAAVRADPNDAVARIGLARCQRAMHPPAVALATLRPLTEEPSPSAAVWLLAGELALDEDRAADAEAWLRRAVAAAPHDRDANQALARALHRLGRADEGAPFAAKAEEVGRDHKRMEQITRDVAEKPGDVGLRYEAGVILARLGEDAGAARWLLSALAVDPKHQPTRDALAACAARLGDPPLADYARRVLAAQPEEARR